MKLLFRHVRLGRVVIESRYDDNFVVTGGTTGCRFDSLQCRQSQWRQSCHHDNYPFQYVSREHDNYPFQCVSISNAPVSVVEIQIPRYDGMLLVIM